MIYARAIDPVEAVAEGFDPGLTGTIGVRVLDPGTNTTIVPRQTAGISELVVNGGVYGVTLDPIGQEGSFLVVWDDNATPPQVASEELLVSNAPVITPPGSGYTIPARVRAVVAPAASTEGSASGLSDSELQEAIDEASTIIDSRLASDYTVPFPDPPPAVQIIARDLAAYLATLTYRKGNPLPDNDPVARRYAVATGLLDEIVKGKAILPQLGSGDAGQAAVQNAYEGDLFRLEDFGLGATGYAPVPGPYRSIRMD